MSAPFYQYGLFGDEFSLIVAFIIGIGFGFFLERAGFGSARKLIGQFYLKDMTVLKVMFTAIVTAMLGIFFLSVFGFVDLSLVYLTDTFILPQILGGLLLGVGFVVGGYCPGTSVVSCSTGKLDGLVYLIGVLAGVFIFGESFPFIKDFYLATPMGKMTIPKFFNMGYGFVVFLVVLMALGGFFFSEWAEKKFGYKKAEGINK